ncbi:MAG: P22 phage major capsid protein family protein [Euryarchaeota archaeon]|nr:P22 phage major capsid protein family protein [Euryarchaeota archaeon]
MAITNFIGEVWAAQILQNLQKSLVYGQVGVINRDYEGDVKGKGDTVRITAHGPITIENYDRSVGIGDPEELDDASTTLEIDQAKYFNFRIEDIDAAQMNVALMESATRDAAYQLAEVADEYIASVMVAQAGLAVGSDVAPKIFDGSTDSVAEELLAVKVAMDEANVPTAGRWVVMPPWLVAQLIKDGWASMVAWSGTEGIMMNAEVAKLFAFNILQSNNVPNTDGDHYKVIAGVSRATTFADSVNETEAYRPEKFFADALRGLHCYGAKVVDPECLCVLTCSPSGGDEP